MTEAGCDNVCADIVGGTNKEKFKHIRIMIKRIWFFIALLAFSFKVHAYTDNVDGVTYFVDPEKKEAVLFRWKRNVYGHVNIPSYIMSGKFEHKERIKVTEISGGAFSNCVNLTSVSIPNTVTHIDGFYSCYNLTSVNIPNSATSIEHSAFSGCSSLTSVSIPNSVTSIGSHAFKDCSSLTSISIPNSVISIGSYAFSGCSSLTSITIPNSVTSIGGYAFSGCSSLTSISIPNSVSVFTGGFRNCSNLSTVVLGNSVKEIGCEAFYHVPNVIIYCNALIPPTLCFGGIDLPSFKNYDATLIVPKESESLYRAAEGWKNFFIADGLKAEAYSDFYGTLAPEKRYEAKGITADGESKLIMYIDDDKDFSGGPAPEIHVKLNGGEVCADEKVTGTIGNWQKLDNGKWGFTYTAPQDYIGTDNSFLLDIELVGENSSLTACGQIKVYRPGVLFLHGLNSSKECFKYIHSELLKNDYTMAQLLNGDYEGTNRSTFYDNTYVHKIVQKHLEQLYNQLTGVGIVSSKYDLVGHSMGGILSRLYSQEVNKDAVNRIITINTPHYGSNMPNVVERLRRVFKNILKNASIIYRPAILSASQLILYKAHDFLNGAGNDLMSNSIAIQNLNDKHVNVPVHALCSIMNGDDDVDKRIFLYCENNIETGLTELYLNVFNTRVNSFHDILNVELGSNQHDGVVTLESQCCGLTNNHVTIEEAPYRGVLGEKSDAHHINTCRWNETVNNLHSLLQSPKSSDKFCATGFPMTDLSVQQSQARANEKDDNIEFVEPVDSSYIKINVEVRNDSIKTAYVTVDKSGDMAAYSIFSFIDDNRMLIGSNKDTLRFALPEDYAGNLTFYAMGRTSYNALVCDSANVELTNDLTMNYLLYENRDTLYLTVGQSLSPAVIVGWNNGQEQYYSPEFTTDNTSILQIDNDIVTAIQTGVCMLKASAGEASDSVYVRVMENPSVVTGIHEIMNEGMKVFNRQHQLVLRFGNDYTGNLDVKFYSIDGRSVKEVNRNIEMRSGEQFYIDLTDLAKQLYVVRIKFKNEVMGYKMLLK